MNKNKKDFILNTFSLWHSNAQTFLGIPLLPISMGMQGPHLPDPTFLSPPAPPCPACMCALPFKQLTY